MNIYLPDTFQWRDQEFKEEWLAKHNIRVPHSDTIPRTRQRMLWLLRYIANTSHKGITAWDEETVDIFVEAFPEAKRSLKVYLMGANSSPMLNRAASDAKKRGFLKAGHIGNQDARSYNRRTWCRYWTITALGEAELVREHQEKV